MINEEKISAIVMRYANYKDDHRMLSLYCAKYGIVSVSSPACRRMKSPLRAASEMFVFGEFHIKAKNDRYEALSPEQCRGGKGRRRKATSSTVTPLASCLLPQIPIESASHILHRINVKLLHTLHPKPEPRFHYQNLVKIY